MEKLNFQDLPSTETPINADNLNQMQDNIENAFEAVDYTSQCTFTNCTFDGGAIYKIGRIVFVQIVVTATIDGDWHSVVGIPSELYPIATTHSGTLISGTDFWVYGLGGQGTAIIGTLEKDKSYAIVGSYLANN